MRYLVMVESKGQDCGIDSEGNLYTHWDLEKCPLYTLEEARRIAMENEGRIFEEEEIF